MKYVPNLNKVLLKIVKKEEKKTSSTIVMPDTVEPIVTCRYADVVVAGGSKEASLSLNPGDSVVIGRFGGVELDIDGVSHLVVSYDDILLKEEK